MHHRFLSRAWLALLLACCFTLPGARAASPNVTLEGLDGKKHHLSEYIGKGKWVVFNIWGPGCPPCVEEMPELQFFHDANKDKTAIVVGAAIDFPSFGYAKKDKVKKFVDDNLISFPILLTDRTITEQIGIGVLAGTPITLIFNREGKLMTFKVGMVTRKLLEDYIRAAEAKKAS